MQTYGLKAVELIWQQIEPIRDQVVVISFSYEALLQLRSLQADVPIGWVLPSWNDENRLRAQQLAPQYLFVDEQFCPDDQAEIWPGEWQWVAYTVNDAEQVAHFAGLGIEIIETDRFSELSLESDIVEVSNDF